MMDWLFGRPRYVVPVRQMLAQLDEKRAEQAVKVAAHAARKAGELEQRIAALEADNAELRRRIGLPETRKE